METREIGSLDELNTCVVELCALLALRADSTKATVIALHGDLGAGKTTLVQHLAHCLGVEEVVTSPTFVVMKRYAIGESALTAFLTLVHIDAYRIEDLNEMGPLRFEELLKEGNTLICIEWAERIATLLPEDTLHVTLTLTDNKRTLVY